MSNAPSHPYYQALHSDAGQAVGISLEHNRLKALNLQRSLKTMAHNVTSSVLNVSSTTNSKEHDKVATAFFFFMEYRYFKLNFQLNPHTSFRVKLSLNNIKRKTISRVTFFIERHKTINIIK